MALEFDYEPADWKADPDRAYEEAVRRIQLTRDAADPRDRISIRLGDLAGLKAVPPGLGQIEGLAEFSARRIGTGPPRSELRDISPLSDATGLTSVDILYSIVSNLEPLAALTRLERLSFAGTDVKDIAALRRMPALRQLFLGGCDVSDFMPLSSLTGLRELSLDYTNIKDLQSLASLVDLETLYLEGTQIESLGPLRGHAALRVLNLSDSNVSDLSPLLDLPRFAEERPSYLDFARTPAAASDPELERISTLRDREQCAREAVRWLRAKAPHAPPEEEPAPEPSDQARAVEAAADVAVVVRREHLIAVDQLGADGGPGRVGPSARQDRLDGLRTSVADLLEEIEQGVAGQAPRDLVLRLTRYREKLAAEPPRYHVIDPPLRRLAAMLAPAHRGDLAQMLDAGFLAGLDQLVADHEEIAPYFRPAAERQEQALAQAPDLAPDAAPPGARELVSQLGRIAEALEANRLADASLGEAVEATGELLDGAQDDLPAGERQRWLKRVFANVLSISMGIVRGASRIRKEAYAAAGALGGGATAMEAARPGAVREAAEWAIQEALPIWQKAEAAFQSVGLM